MWEDILKMKEYVLQKNKSDNILQDIHFYLILSLEEAFFIL